MTDEHDQIRKELDELIVTGYSWITEADKKKGSSSVRAKSPASIRVGMIQYQSWYSRALPLVKLTLPERVQEFVELYKVEKRKEIDFTNYGISDYLLGLKVSRGMEEIVNPKVAFLIKFQQQLAILGSLSARLDSALADITSVLEAELFDDELSKCKELLRAAHLRAAGTVAGVVLESHLSSVCSSHDTKPKKKNPALGDYNQTLKDAGVLDTPNWRWIQRLGDIRNLCGHAKEREPTHAEVEELIAGVEKAIKTVF